MGKGASSQETLDWVGKPPGYLVRVATPKGAFLVPCVFSPAHSRQQQKDARTLYKLAEAGRIPIRNTTSDKVPNGTGIVASLHGEKIPVAAAQTVEDGSSSEAERAPAQKISTPVRWPTTTSTSTTAQPVRIFRRRLPANSLESDFTLAGSTERLPEQRMRVGPSQTAELCQQEDSVLCDDGQTALQSSGPAYSVRYVATKRKKGKAKTARGTIARAIESEGKKEGGEDGEDEEADQPRPSLLGQIRSFARPGGLRHVDMGERHVPALDDGDGSSVELLEYVVLDEDDLASMAGSWVELESVVNGD